MFQAIFGIGRQRFPFVWRVTAAIWRLLATELAAYCAY